VQDIAYALRSTPAPLIRYTILALYKFICMYVCIFLPFQVSSFSKSDCLDFISSDPNLTDLTPLDYQVWRQCWRVESYQSCNQSCCTWYWYWYL